MRLLVTTVALLFLLPASAQAADGDLIVKRAPGLDGAERAELRADAGVELVETLPLERTELVRAADPARALVQLRADDDVVYAEPDRPMHLTRTMNDSGFKLQWALDNTGQAISGQKGIAGDDIDATTAWDRSDGAGVTVAVVDTGIAADHVDLVHRIATNPAEAGGTAGVDDDRNGYVDDLHGWDFVSGDAVAQDGNGHGTHVSGTIAAEGENSVGVVGVAPHAKILPLRVVANNGSGTVSNIAKALNYAGDMGVRIVNASLGGGDSPTIQAAIAAHPNTLYVVAAGNNKADSGTDPDAFPCALPEANIVCVGATDNRDQIASFSNYGAVAVDLFAPGVDITSPDNRSPWSFSDLDGTSMAAPHVAGVAALELAARPGASAAFLRHALLSSVDAKPGLAGKSATGGRLNANSAVTAILGTDPTLPPTPTPEPPVETPAPGPPLEAPAPVAPVPTPAPGAPVPALTISKLSISGSLRSKAGKLRVSFRLSGAARVRYTVKAKGAKRAAGTWTKPGKAGANTALIKRKLPSGKTLKRGSYTLTVTVSPTAASSRVIRVR